MSEADEVAEARRFLLDLGATEADLDAVAPSELPGVTSDVLLGRGVSLSARDLAERVGADPEDIADGYRRLGVTVDDLDATLFREEEVQLVQLLRAAVGADEDQESEAHFTEQEGHELLGVTGRSVAAIADALVAGYVQTIEARLVAGGGTLLDWANLNAEFTTLALQQARSLDPLLLHHLRQSVEQQRQAQAGVSSRAVMRLAVGFVDLVGFTPLSSRLSPEDLSRLVGEFEDQARDLARAAGARIVKHIGDEVMFTAVDPAAACRLARDLRDSFSVTADQARGGLAYGEVITRHGDYYGPVVNLASRLTAEAVPGEILAAEAVRDAVPDLDCEPGGRRLLKGFDEPIRVLSLR